MDPPSPSKFPMSPGMPLFPVSPERAAGTKPLYGAPTAQSPSLPDLRLSPLRKHRRNDSDVSVQGLAVMFENLEVKDFKEAQAKYKRAMEKQKEILDKAKDSHEKEIKALNKKHAEDIQRHDLRVEELRQAERELRELRAQHDNCPSKKQWDAARQQQREADAQWMQKVKEVEEYKKHMEAKLAKMQHTAETYRSKCHVYKSDWQAKSEECTRLGNKIPNLLGKVQGLERTIQRLESDLKFNVAEAEKYKSQVYNLQVNVEAVRDQSAEEVQALKDKLMLAEGERDALKTSLKEEEVLRIAAEGQIPLPAATTEEHDEFGSPVRSPRKQRTPERDEDDKENVEPKKAIVEMRLMQSELVAEKRLRERAQEQIEFMKMECQFRCCSCRIADSKGSKYIHDGSYTAEMERIKASVPNMTPPPSDHGDDPMEGVTIKQEPAEDQRPFSPRVEENSESHNQSFETTVIVNRMKSITPEAEVLFSPTTGTFRSVPSPVKGSVTTEVATPAMPSQAGLSVISEATTDSSPWIPDANSTMIPVDNVSRSTSRATSRSASRPHSRTESVAEKQPTAKSSAIVIHEDAILDSDEDTEAQDPHDPSEPATPGPYITRTITTTTTIPLHFSPFTPAKRSGNVPMTPSTVAHAPANAQTPVLGELSMNQLPFDRAAALEAIRQRRGRARSMAAGHGTPQKQMMEGVKERRDISAPVSKFRR
ncbi:hypothetical protein K458DRAFT_478185 [Lentithecium fluviatile CBS 122367]|uniref:Uncharacterized protein n=1 Tax=Lentithecium fluviatile CBS 122367 TaxID=1168545 RepID=A0A6G1J027_9PLEO|nr:hypothetical protein K458DRAFT_478185 [Lentithecium fluviatile CBS 122367]